MLVVYVDDFLLQTKLGDMRSAFLAAVGKVWTLAKEEILTPDHPITFLGIDLVMQANGDYFAHQERFVKSLLEKYGHTKHKGNQTVQVDKVPDQPDPPEPSSSGNFRASVVNLTGWPLALVQTLHTMYPC